MLKIVSVSKHIRKEEEGVDKINCTWKVTAMPIIRKLKSGEIIRINVYNCYYKNY